ncbi:MAG: M15 family metallopeptidase [Halioglobus sp.]
MKVDMTVEQLMGRDEHHLTSLANGHRLHRRAAEAFENLQRDAQLAGFQLEIASSFRSFERQCGIWNGKVAGERPVHDDTGQRLVVPEMSEDALLHAILRYSALPGTSRHHWGSDLDVFDAGAMPEGYQLQLSPQEVAAGGMFDPLHCWLDERMALDQSYGFFRPYDVDRGGVAPERWHLSFAPVACACESPCYRDTLESALATASIGLYEKVRRELNPLLQRYVAVPETWCPQHYRG